MPGKEKQMLKNILAALVAASLVVSPVLAGGDMVKGEVVKVDKAAGKVTLKHGPIKKLDMDSMTMVFRVADPAMLDKMKAGDKIEFEADRVNGALTVTKIGREG
jgi:Cu/Ag efflux protein CusF